MKKYEEGIGVLLFWVSVGGIGYSFTTSYWYSYIFFLLIVPVFYGSHEALHGCLLHSVGGKTAVRVHNLLAGMLGTSLQFMNFILIKKAHFQHHTHGRTDSGYSPDILPHQPKLFDYLFYYFSLLGGTAFLYQIGGFANLILPKKYLTYDFQFNLKHSADKRQYYLAQSLVLAFIIYAIYFGGLVKFLIYLFLLNIIWGLLQNVSHYGLIGINSETDKVCANSYYLEWPFKMMTYGSTAHIAHHLLMDIPGLQLYEKRIATRVEEKLKVTLQPKYGVLVYIKDILKQFKGPMYHVNLTSSWCIQNSAETMEKEVFDFQYGYRKGRKWHSK